MSHGRECREGEQEGVSRGLLGTRSMPSGLAGNGAGCGRRAGNVFDGRARLHAQENVKLTMVPDTMPSLPLSNASLPVSNPPAIPGPFYICSAFYTDTESTRARCARVAPCNMKRLACSDSTAGVQHIFLG